MSLQLPIPMEFSGTSTSTGAATEIALDTGRGGYCYLKLESLEMKHSAGSAVTIQGSIGNATGYTNTSVNCKYLGTATAVATLINAVGLNTFMKSDSAGKVYLRFGPSAGTDNTIAYSIVFSVY